MNGTRGLVAGFVAFAAAIVALEVFLNRGPLDATFLLVLTFWTMLVQGCVALVAVGEIAKGLWLIPIKRDLLSFYPLLFFTALLYPLTALRMEIYGWTEHPTAWLNVRFFLARNTVLLLLAAWVAQRLARAVMAQSARKNTYAVYYLFLFVASESLIAFDWIMSLEYPWISTLFGGYFFIQSFLMGLLVSTYVILLRWRKEPGLTETLRDTGKMMFGFCFLWGGFFFAQYLPIWYGNMPEEVDYVLKRVGSSPYRELSRAVLLMVFAVPFVSLLSRKIKTVPPAMAVVSTVVIAGMFLEKVVLITPVVPVRPLLVGLEMALMATLSILVFRARNSYMPQLVAQAGPARSHTVSGEGLSRSR